MEIGWLHYITRNELPKIFNKRGKINDRKLLVQNISRTNSLREFLRNYDLNLQVFEMLVDQEEYGRAIYDNSFMIGIDLVGISWN